MTLELGTLVGWAFSLLVAGAVGWLFGRHHSRSIPVLDETDATNVQLVSPVSEVQLLPSDDPSRWPWLEGSEGLQFVRLCADRLAHSIAESLRSTTEPMTGHLLEIRTSLAELSAELHRHDKSIRSGDDLQRVESLAQRASESMEEMAQVSRRSALAFDEHLGALQRSQSTILDASSKMSDLAARINVLSINASIQAARAGEAGRGFKVIAGQVKALAQESTALLHSIEATVVQNAGLFAGIRDDLNLQKGAVAKHLEQQKLRFVDFRDEFAGLRQTFGSLVSVIARFLTQLEQQISRFSPVAQNHEITVQELENFAVVVSDALSALAADAAAQVNGDAQHGLPPISATTAQFWAAQVRRHLTTANELHQLESILTDLGVGAVRQVSTIPPIELF